MIGRRRGPLMAGAIRCMRHPRRRARLTVVWADGRGVWRSCSRECIRAWKRGVGKWACIVEIKDCV